MALEDKRLLKVQPASSQSIPIYIDLLPFEKPFMQLPAIIETHGLSKKFRHSEEWAVNNISFSIYSNEIFGLLGPNGAGKTTTISMLCGFFPASSGSIIIDGKDIADNMMAVKNVIGIVPQDIALYPTLTGRENLRFYGCMYGVYGEKLDERINEWLEKLGLTAAADKRVSTYSGGMKRRVNLIAGILHQPKILFLDEPTVGVDVQSRNVIIEHLKDLNSKGTTIVYTSHHMEEAETFCTRISIIDYGHILTEGTPSDLISKQQGCRNLEDVFLALTHRKLRD